MARRGGWRHGCSPSAAICVTTPLIAVTERCVVRWRIVRLCRCCPSRSVAATPLYSRNRVSASGRGARRVALDPFGRPTTRRVCVLASCLSGVTPASITGGCRSVDPTLPRGRERTSIRTRGSRGLRPTAPLSRVKVAEPASGEVLGDLRRTAWQMEREGRALSKALAVSVDAPAMTDGDLSRQP